MRVLFACASLATAFVPRPALVPRTPVSLHAAKIPPHIADMCDDTYNPSVEGGLPLLLDVREVDEWALGHFADAVPAPLSTLLAGTRPANKFTGAPLGFDKKLYIYCAAGIRSAKAAQVLGAMGYTTLVPLKEGYQDLVAMDIADTETGAAAGISGDGSVTELFMPEGTANTHYILGQEQMSRAEYQEAVRVRDEAKNAARRAKSAQDRSRFGGVDYLNNLNGGAAAEDSVDDPADQDYYGPGAALP